MPLQPDLPLQARFIKWSRIFAGLLLVGVVLVLLGWIFNVSFLFRPLPGSIPMNPLTAVCFLLCAVAFFISDSSIAMGKMASTGLLVIVFVLGLLRFLELATGTQVNFDMRLFSNRVAEYGSVRMSVMTAASFMLLSATMIRNNIGRLRRFLFFHYTALIGGLGAWFVFLGFIYRVESIWDIRFGPMALYTSIGFVFLAVAVILSKPAEGFMKPLTRSSRGSMAIRLITPAALLVPSLLGWLRVLGDWYGIYPSRLGILFFTLGFIIIFLFVAVYVATVLNRRDLKEKEGKEALWRSEEQLEAIFGGAPDPVMVIDENGVVVRWNPEAEKLFLWTTEEAIGKKLKDLIIPPEFHNAHERGMARYIRTGVQSIMGRTVDMVALDKRGKQIDVSLRIAPVKLKGQILFVGFLRDIREKKKIERQMLDFNRVLSRQVEQKTKELTEIFERLTDGFIALDSELRYTYMNARAGQITRRDPAEVIGKRIWDEFPDAVGTETYKAIEKAINEQCYVVNVDRYEPLDLWQENHIYPSGSGLVIIIRDITEYRIAEMKLRKNQEKYRTLVEEASDAILVFSPKENRFVEVNKKAMEMFGFSLDELMGSLEQKFKFSMLSLPTEKLEKGESVRVETVLTSAMGEEMTVETSAKRMTDGNYLAIIRDITQRKKAEGELKRLNEELRKLTGHLHRVREEERTHMAREIHDELGQQLTVMKMDASWVSKRLSESEESVREKMAELLIMIDHTVKSIRRISSELRPSLLDDLGLVAAMDWHLEEFHRRSGIAKEFQSEPNHVDLPDLVKINLFRIFQESLTNIARHAEATRVNVRLKTENNELILTIVDNGKGFAKESAGKKTLGILGMKERTLMIGGKFQISGESGGGTKVTVVIPANR